MFCLIAGFQKGPASSLECGLACWDPCLALLQLKWRGDDWSLVRICCPILHTFLPVWSSLAAPCPSIYTSLASNHICIIPPLDLLQDWVQWWTVSYLWCIYRGTPLAPDARYSWLPASSPPWQPCCARSEEKEKHTAISSYTWRELVEVQHTVFETQCWRWGLQKYLSLHCTGIFCFSRSGNQFRSIFSQS